MPRCTFIYDVDDGINKMGEQCRSEFGSAKYDGY